MLVFVGNFGIVELFRGRRVREVEVAGLGAAFGVGELVVARRVGRDVVEVVA